MLRAVFEQHRLPYVGLRYMNIYGPRMDYHGVYVSVIMKALDRILAAERPVIFGDGSQVYDFIYVRDAARANLLGMQADCVDMNFNVGTGLGTSINDLVLMLLKLTKADLAPEYRAQAHSFVTHRIGSVDQAAQHLGFRAAVPLSEGLKSVVDWRLAEHAAHVLASSRS
jgi:UDP-glucose 4-epimerase